ncbi:DNA gyrase subunit A [Romeria aff. gracilis LEGE 07310]|uniref:DNA topoisomerase (ATP-hydrolyzing) n=1 Tax=Vasconcelosia minhoensis LEGE 07310 TaxID=915328 RepID=A0A8J7AYK4_9CYAN|nr:DNA gyrase subunit A [Romeria gracilis]MBE9078657.1 DNA gyrase subunit A [Romeria aff. gracilis LEGE 07310]
MAKQLNLSEQIVVTALHTEVQQSYLEYAMSVIVGRALPDARDGLKPVHRRILYAMHELGLTPDRPFRKCARVVGDVLGKYHPHGDQAVYDALVRMVQDFSSRYPLLTGHGNFGSVDNDPPAAMRYTETRLASVSHEALLSDVGEATVDFIDNFDSSQQEPIVLPAQLPNLLLNGSSGIAVGMATNIPPHNLGEVVDGLIALIDRPTLSDEKLFELIPGPDFPTGGEIIDAKGINDAYRTGRGSIPVRGIAQFEEIQLGRGRQRRNAIVVTELPYQVNKASWIEKIANLVNQGRIEGIADIRDESDRDGMRVVIELKREAQPPLILNDLYRLTPLQSNFGAIMLAIDQGQPRQLSLREMLQAFLDFRETTLVRQYRHELEKAQQRLHLVEGMLIALNNLDDVIEILRQSADGSTAKVELQNEFDLSPRQADEILAMPLRRLTGLERKNLETEADSRRQRIAELEHLLSDRKALFKALKKELRSLKKEFGDERRTRLQSSEARAEEKQMLAEIVAEESETILEFSRKGYVRRSSPRAFQRRQARQKTDSSLQAADDFTVQTEQATVAQELLVLTRDGKAYTLDVGAIPLSQRQAKGQSKGLPLVGLLPDAVTNAPETLVAQLLLNDERLQQQLILVTAQGRIKRLPASGLTHLTGRGLTALKLKDDDQLQYAFTTPMETQLVIATSGGRLLRFRVDEDQLPSMGRTAQGPQAIRLPKQERLVGCVPVTEGDALLLVSAKGYAKRMRVSNLKLSNRGGIGSQSFKFSLKQDQLTAILPAIPETNFTVLTDQDRMAQLPVDEVTLQGRSQTCDRVLTPARSEVITAAMIAELVDADAD